MSKYVFSYVDLGPPLRLGWVAKVPIRGGVVEVQRGDLVECNEDWFVEGCWNGDFQDGCFDASSCFFGSGVCIRHGCVIAVSSRATVDRITYCIDNDFIWISNSLTLLMARTHATLLPTQNYAEIFHAACYGIKNYPDAIPVAHPTIRKFHQQLYGNVVINGTHISRALPKTEHFAGTFQGYCNFLAKSLTRLHDNCVSPARRFPLKSYATLSTGYDSVAVTVLAQRYAGVTECFTTVPRSAKEAIENGHVIAKKLGLQPHLLDHTCKDIGSEEIFFLASRWYRSETLYYTASRHIEAGGLPAVVFTGFHGDKVWERELDDKYNNDEIRRGDTSGSGLSEIRLKSGFINVAVPFIGARNLSTIFAISRSQEMKPWSVGGSYDRPIPRRIGEEAGLPREDFGFHKKLVSMGYEMPIDTRIRRKAKKGLQDLFSIGPARRLSCIVLGYLKKKDKYTIYDRVRFRLLRWRPSLHYYVSMWAVTELTNMLANYFDEASPYQTNLRLNKANSLTDSNKQS